MKNSILLKFIALFLCAASLLGILGGGLGILAVSELGLNSRTPKEAYQDTIRATAEALANELAVRYAARNLGNASESLIQDYYGSHWINSNFNWAEVGYAINDTDGTVLEESPYPDNQEIFATFLFDADARYLHVNRVLTEEEHQALTTPATTAPVYDPELAEDLMVYNIVPDEGCRIYSVRVVYSDGSIADYGPEAGYLGQLSYMYPKQLAFYVQSDYADSKALMDDIHAWMPLGMTFRDWEGNTVFEITSPAGVLTAIHYDSHNPHFVLSPMGNAQPLEPGSIFDAIPEGGINVSECTFTYAGGWTETVGSNTPIGSIVHDENSFVVFIADCADILPYSPENLTHIAFRDPKGNPVYEARDIGSVGNFVLKNNTLMFISRDPSAPAETPEVPATEAPLLYVYDDVPPGGYEVYRMEYWLEGNTRGSVLELSLDSLGQVHHGEDGQIRFTARDWKQFVFSKPASVVYIHMEDEEGRLLFEARQEGVPTGTGCSVGTFAYDEEGVLVFSMTGTANASLSPASFSRSSAEEMPAPSQVTEAPTEVTVSPEESEPTPVPTEPPPASNFLSYYDHSIGEIRFAEYSFEPLPAYTVSVTFGPNALTSSYAWVLMEILYAIRDYLLYVLLGSLLLFAVTAVYLCCSAAHRPGSDLVRPGGLNRLPLDLYLALAGGGITLCGFGILEGCRYLISKDIQTAILFGVLLAYCASLLFTAFCFAFAAQAKTSGGYLWRNSICGHLMKLLGWFWRKFLACCRWFLKFLDRRLEPMLVRFCKALWKLVKFFLLQLKRCIVWAMGLMHKGLAKLHRAFLRFFSLLPLIWQWLLTGFVLVLLLYIMMRTYKVGYILIGFGTFFGVLLYAASAFGTLLESAKQMRKGNLDQKVDDKLLIGSFRDFADELNGLADVAVVAAQKQLKSERMKTELITNVSHDIKTPLTSIINYVDLMEKPHSPQEQQAYLEVLSRQSQRLKKQVDDLMEMSKASTGNMAVEISQVDATEAVNQALGEFADKLEKNQLIPVFRQPESEIHMMADGRLVWRVLSNLLSNTVKYALPGTRVYIDLMELEGKVVLSLKNISREPLNVSAEELLERFVRGDVSRNTEGSGLGLNIAKSLMELQKGRLELLVDGDLFKVTLIFPGA